MFPNYRGINRLAIKNILKLNRCLAKAGEPKGVGARFAPVKKLLKGTCG